MSAGRELVLPVGTQVVTRVPVTAAGREYPRGAVGVVVKVPVDATHAYRVRLPDETEVSLRRAELAARKEVQRGGLGGAEGADGGETTLDEAGLREFVIYRCVVGSWAYGLAEAESDRDRRGIFLPPADRQWSLTGAPEQVIDDGTMDVYWELRKFLILALKANPNVLECLYTPLVELATPLTEELLALRGAFLSKLVYQTYNGYVLSQFKKLEADLRQHGQIKLKHAMHLIRLLLSGTALLREGVVQVDVGEHRARLLAIRRGEMPWAEVNTWRLALHRDFDAAFASTTLPERPDYDRANAFLLRARRSMVAA